jgi:hypothetical protein
LYQLDLVHLDNQIHLEYPGRLEYLQPYCLVQPDLASLEHLVYLVNLERQLQTLPHPEDLSDLVHLDNQVALEYLVVQDHLHRCILSILEHLVVLEFHLIE